MNQAPAVEQSVTLIVSARVKPGSEAAFAQWQARWQSAVLASPGALSCDIWPAAPPDQDETVALVRFQSTQSLREWRTSELHKTLMSDVSALVEGGWVTQLAGAAAAEYYVQRTATELIVTKIRPGKEAAYRQWCDRIGNVQSQFPGYLGSLVRPPQGKDDAWTTVIRFDTIDHLNAWLQSPRRLAMLKEAEDLMDDVVVQHVDSSFPGWVPNDPQTGKPPSKWRTGCLVLLALLPIVMLEIMFLDPHLQKLQRALWALIDVSIGVTLTTYPIMPWMVKIFDRWLFPQTRTDSYVYGAIVAGVFLIEMTIGWLYVHA